MFVERLNSKQKRICSARIAWKVRCQIRSFYFTAQIISHKPLLAEISNINIFHITQYFWAKSYKRNQWNLPNILAYISGISDDFFRAGLVPLTSGSGTTMLLKLYPSTGGGLLHPHADWFCILPENFNIIPKMTYYTWPDSQDSVEQNTSCNFVWGPVTWYANFEFYILFTFNWVEVTKL